MYSEEDLLPVSGIQHLLFCERRAALLMVEGLWADNLYTAEGSILHNRVDADMPLESRGELRIARGLLLRSLTLGLSGKADVVEFHRLPDNVPSPVDELASGIALAGTDGQWQPFPVEYKRGRLRHEEGYEAQLCAQAICLEEMLGVSVSCGAIFFGKNRRRKPVRFDAALREVTVAAARHLHEIVESARTPKGHYSRKCQSCSMKELCLPRISGGNGVVAGYLSRMLSEI